jgi:hypothetical protein
VGWISSRLKTYTLSMVKRAIHLRKVSNTADCYSYSALTVRNGDSREIGGGANAGKHSNCVLSTNNHCSTRKSTCGF